MGANPENYGLVHERYTYLKENESMEGNNSTAIPRKVKILVMGGSLVVGVNCRRIVKDLSLSIQMPNRLCTWTHRLETLLNNLIGADIFTVHKVALGGTNTATGYALWQNDFFEPEQKNPDILINAFSTNDMHVLTVQEAQNKNQTLRDKVMEMNQDFARSVLKGGDCAPLLLHMDDYLGNEQREILTTLQLSQAVSTLAHYYGFASMSYANVVRDFVYGDTHETWFSPPGWYKEDKMEREIHPMMGMHIVASWVAAYNLLHMVTSFCTIEKSLSLLQQGAYDTGGCNAGSRTSIAYKQFGSLPRFLLGDSHAPVIPGKPKDVPCGLIPELTPELSLENVTETWQSAPARPFNNECIRDATVVRCPFSWISGISNNGLDSEYTQAYFDKYAMDDQHRWKASKDGKKLGMVASQEQRHMVLDFLQQEKPLGSITLFYMKSYGEK